MPFVVMLAYVDKNTRNDDEDDDDGHGDCDQHIIMPFSLMDMNDVVDSSRPPFA
jgi:hypothetical protein